MIKVLFVCHGNICRSPMAEMIFKFLVSNAGVQDKFIVDSAGTSDEEARYFSTIHKGTKNVLTKNNIPFTEHIARQFTLSDYDKFDYIIENKFDIPAIVLSARGEEYDKLHGFDLGIDDYVVKPFSPKELIMRVNAVLHRYRSTISEKENTNIWRYGDLVIDDNARIVKINNERIDMTPKEYNLLMYLINNENKAVTREQILSQIWGYDFFGDDRTLDTHMKLLRKKLGDYGQCIVTLRGIGYRFEKTKL